MSKDFGLNIAKKNRLDQKKSLQPSHDRRKHLIYCYTYVKEESNVVCHAKSPTLSFGSKFIVSSKS